MGLGPFTVWHMTRIMQKQLSRCFLRRLVLWETRVLDDSVRQVCDTCFGKKGKSKSCLVKAPAQHTGESVRVVSEL